MPGKDALDLLTKDPNLILDESVILRGPGDQGNGYHSF